MSDLAVAYVEAFRQFQYPSAPLHADLAMKERALARTAPRDIATKRYRPTDSLLNFLENL